MSNKNFVKTSINLPVGLANAFGGKGQEMKKAVLEIRPSYLLDAALHKLLRQYKIRVEKGTTDLWENKDYFDELFTILLPNPSDRLEKTNVKLHLTTDERACTLLLSGEDTLTTAFCSLLLLHYARQQQNNMKQVEKNITDYYNQYILGAAKKPRQNTSPSDTGLKVLGNKKWFMEEFKEILEFLPKHIDTFVEPFMGSGIVTLEAHKQEQFKRIITNDIYWHKANYLRAFLFKSTALKAACLSLIPNQATYDEANKVIEKYRNSSMDEILPDVAAKYLFINYCNKSRGGLDKNKLIEDKKNDATISYKSYLDCLWDSPQTLKDIKVYNEDAMNIIKKHNRKKHLLFLDPPYPETKGYETDFSVKDFENIANAANHYKGSFIFCCRISKKHDKTYSHRNAYGIDDLHIKHIIDKCFSGHKRYYQDYLFSKGGVAIERVITNFPFDGCRHYDTGQPWQGK